MTTQTITLFSGVLIFCVGVGFGLTNAYYYMHLTQLEILFNHFGKVFTIFCLLIGGALLIDRSGKLW